ncbi:MAG TPA: isoaspartyl peptidase/L-asparaginase [Polyangiaceae bacterium]|jgi:beta-aspartyl-peptidase (threonine type)
MTLTASWSGGGGGWSILVHGGAGHGAHQKGPETETGCRLAAQAAAELLGRGGSALDAVELAVKLLEDDPNYNAGTGASLTVEGRLELDASIMDGRTLALGAVCALSAFKNPVLVARKVLESGRHVLYAGAGADRFAREHGSFPVEENSMITDGARQRLAGYLVDLKSATEGAGTVGAIARDASGSVAAATSTGGLVGKQPGRVGDSPIAGAGTYADDTAGAVSSTGHGEGILRVALASSVIFALRAGSTPEQAASSALTMMQRRVASTGGLIVVDRAGRLAWARTTPSMAWAAVCDGATHSGG